ncbi:MAG: Leucyl aminopeptidase [Candidatus Kapaibacterium sp.]|nr:MAG: Leucyl aminopeptidase [Candidatus Kapabacteria bacterium]
MPRKKKKEEEKELTLQDAARIALQDYLGVTSVETLLVLSDEPLRDIGLTFFEVGKEIAHETFYCEIKPREVNGQEPPEPIANLMQEVDVVVAPTSKSITHTNARREASKLGVRIATMPGITAETMLRCLSADANKILETTEKVAKKLQNVSTIRVTTELGTDITLPIKNRTIIKSTGILRNIGEYGNLPSGEVYLAPWEKQSNGVIVFDGSIAGIGILKHPVKVVVEDGYGVDFEGDEEAKQLYDMLKSIGHEAFAIGEFGIGTNYKAKITGIILEDEKVLGTVHIAFGNNLTMGGKIKAKGHIDGIITKPNVYFDDKLIMKEGKLLI